MQDFRVHVNSVKISTPDFRHTETPWLDVRVRLVSGPSQGRQGVVKDVQVSPLRSLAITVRLDSGELLRSVVVLAIHRRAVPNKKRYEVGVFGKNCGVQRCSAI